MTGLSATYGTTTRRRRTAFLALLVALSLALGLTVLSAGSASAQPFPFKFKNVSTGKCMWESRTTPRTVYAAACSNTNNSNYWDYGGSSTPMKNAYSGKCLTTDTSFYNVYAASCTSNNDYQRWISTGIPGTNYFEIISYAVGQCLWGVSGSSTLHLGNCSSSNHLDWWSSSS
jgi:Ricin-type beta-trefoil lectin domain